MSRNAKAPGRSSASQKQSNPKRKSNFKAPAKQVAIDSLLNKPNVGRMHQYALKMLDPLGQPDLLFPSPLPGRAGSATFPLVLTVTNTGDLANFGIVAQPNLQRPLAVSYNGNTSNSTDPYSFGGVSDPDHAGFPSSLQGHHLGVEVEEQFVGAIPRRCLACRVSTAPYNCTLELNYARTNSDKGKILTFKLSAYASGSWTDITTQAIAVNSSTLTVAGVVFPANTDYISFEFTGAKGHISFGGSLTPTGGSTITISASPGEEAAMDVHYPQWDSLLAVASEVRIVAFTVLVTYRGAALENAGMISACNADEDLCFKDNWYETCSSRPFDTYDGRLGSMGSEEGGAHWHYVPDDLLSLRMSGVDERSTNKMCGYFGIAGLADGQSVRIKAAITLNFFTTNPSYSMTYAPPIRDFSYLIEAMRRDIPLVTSNDGHVEKFKKLAKNAVKKALQYAIDNPQVVASLLSSAALMV